MLHHFADLVLRGEEGAGEVDLQRVVEARFRYLGARAGFAEDAGIVETDVEPAEILHGRSDQRRVEGFAPDVAGDRDGLAARGGDFGDEAVELGLAARADDDARALGGKKFRGLAADPELAPVTIATLFCKRFMTFLLFSGGPDARGR